jgi:hypothetical protein
MIARHKTAPLVNKDRKEDNKQTNKRTKERKNERTDGQKQILKSIDFIGRYCAIAIFSGIVSRLTAAG